MVRSYFSRLKRFRPELFKMVQQEFTLKICEVARFRKKCMACLIVVVVGSWCWCCSIFAYASLHIKSCRTDGIKLEFGCCKKFRISLIVGQKPDQTGVMNFSSRCCAWLSSCYPEAMNQPVAAPQSIRTTGTRYLFNSWNHFLKLMGKTQVQLIAVAVCWYAGESHKRAALRKI